LIHFIISLLYELQVAKYSTEIGGVFCFV